MHNVEQNLLGNIIIWLNEILSNNCHTGIFGNVRFFKCLQLKKRILRCQRFFV